MDEIWRRLIYPNISDETNKFEISNHGKLRNIKTKHIYKLEILRTGYYSVRVSLGSRNKKTHILIHKAVAYTFLQNQNNLPEINHKDGNKLNNNVSNLEWCTSHENQQHKYDIGLFNKNKIIGENNHNAKLSWNDVEYIREHYVYRSKEYGVTALSKKFNVSDAVIISILKNKSWIQN